MNEWTNERMHCKIIICSFVYVSLHLLTKTLKSHESPQKKSQQCLKLCSCLPQYQSLPTEIRDLKHFSSNSSKSPNDRSCPPHSFSSSKLLQYANNHLSVSICFSPQRKDSSIISNSNIKYLPSCPWQKKLGRASPTSIQRTTDYTNTISEPLY